MMTDSEMLEKDKKEFEKASEKEPYKSPFPKRHKPPFQRLQEDKLQLFKE